MKFSSSEEFPCFDIIIGGCKFGFVYDEFWDFKDGTINLDQDNPSNKDTNIYDQLLYLHVLIENYLGLGLSTLIQGHEVE